MMKTVTQVFVTGVKEITTTPALFGDVLEYEGLPLTRFGAEKNDFIKYLTNNKRVSFKYRRFVSELHSHNNFRLHKCIYSAIINRI